MARVAKNSDVIFKIERWLGLNQAPEGGASLKAGEAAEMKNFRVTADGLLKVRGGLKNILALASDYTVSAGEAELLRTDERACGAFTLYPRFEVGADGEAAPAGTPSEISCEGSAAAQGSCMSRDGRLFSLYSCTEREPELSVGSAREYSIGTSTQARTYYRRASVDDDGKITLWGEQKTAFIPYSEGSYDCRGWYFALSDDGRSCCVADSVWDTGEDDYYGFDLFNERRRTATGIPRRWEWRFCPLTVMPAGDETDWTVRGLWSGRLDGEEKLFAAAGGTLWRISEEDGVCSAQSAGTVDTSAGVHMFGFGGRLYVLDGSSYKVLSGGVLSEVAGYVPCVAAATPPSGGGEALERANLLTGKKRQRFSPDGTAQTFTLAENGVDSVDSVKLLGEELTGWTFSLANGTVTLAAAPAEGTDTLEIAWTKGTGDRDRVQKMRFSEIFSGRSDARVFLCGDGTNNLVYSDFGEDGSPTAEYFPELNSISVDSANTPVTAILRHYDRLVSFKPDGAFSTSYDSFTLADGTVTAGFLTSALHRGSGCTAPGQALLIENDPRTVCGAEVLDWKLAGGAARDERYARRISARAEKALSELSGDGVWCFDDEKEGEYYILSGDRGAVHNYRRDLWYELADFPVRRMARWKDRLICGGDGFLMLLSDENLDDNGRAIEARWESGDMDFGGPWKVKHSPELWLSLRPETGTRFTAALDPDGREGEKSELWPGLFSFSNSDFAHLSFNCGEGGMTIRVRAGAKKFCRCRLVLEVKDPGCTAALASADIRVRGRSTVK